MKRLILAVVAALLLTGLSTGGASFAKSKKPPDASPTPAATPTPNKKIKMEAYVLAEFENKNSDGEPERDVIVMVESLINDGPTLTLSYKNFMLKDKNSGRYFPATSTNSKDFATETTVSPTDGELPNFKLYFTVPGDLRADRIYLKTGTDIATFELGR